MNMTPQEMLMLELAASIYGDLFLDIAYRALRNGAHLINCEKPDSRDSVTHPDGITCLGPNRELLYFCRAKLLHGCRAPYAGSNLLIAPEFNAAAVSLKAPERFEVAFGPYPYDREHITIFVKPLQR